MNYAITLFMNSNKLKSLPLFAKLPENDQLWLTEMADRWPLSHQQLRMLTEYCCDMYCWDAGSISRFYQPQKLENLQGKKAAELFFKQIRKGYDSLLAAPRKYPAKARGQHEEQGFPLKQITETELVGNIMGSCPVASDKTRCCMLQTLDAVQQCGFSCSYCSIQSFYHANQVRFIQDLVHHLKNVKLDPAKTYHIGTGQSSDSLMWGNHNGLLDALYDFARANPNVILEMKSKSSRVDYFLAEKAPANMVFTWSLNPQTIIENEETGSAPLAKRLEAARKLADTGQPVGFHFHPIIWYENWEKEYSDLVRKLTTMFTPEEVVMVSLGTLTFIRSVIKKLRSSLRKSTILQMPMEEIGGKLSYPFAIKQELFTTVYKAFPQNWRDEVFFYMCMEDINLWQPVFGRSYPDNESFEADMLNSYQEKICKIAQKLKQ